MTRDGLGDLSFLSAEDREVVMQFLGAVADYPDDHPNRFKLTYPRHAPRQLFLATSGSRSRVPTTQAVTVSVCEPLLGNGFARKLPDTGDTWYEFTEDAIEWFRQNRYSPQEIRSKIGRWLYDRYEDSPNDPISVMIRYLAGDIGITEKRARIELRNLAALKFLVDLTPDDGHDKRFYQFSENGILWAIDDFGAIRQSTLPPIVHVNVDNYVQAVTKLNISVEVKMEFAQVLEELNVELEKDEPRYEPLLKLFSTMADAKELLPLGWRFLSEHHDKVSKMVDALSL